MAVRLADAVAYLKTDDSGLRSGLDDAERRTSSWSTVFGGALERVGHTITDAVVSVARSAVASLGESVSLASDLGETISKTGELFGDSTDAILAWSDTAATEFGQTKQQALDAADTFAIFGKAAGLGGEDLVAFSTDLTQLASDLASFNNTSPEQAIQAIGAALRGEAEPLRAYGVLLDEATLRNAAFSLGLTTSANETLTQQQRVLAAQKVIFDQTTTQQGDFQRTAEGYANQQRILAAQWTDFKTQLGSVFMPVLTEAVAGVNNLVQSVLPPLRDFLANAVVPAMETAAQKLSNVFDWLGDLASGFTGAKDDLSTFADDLGRVWMESAQTITDNMTVIRDNLNVFASWFASDEANAALGWMANTMAALIAFGEAFSNQALYITTAVRLVAEGLEALFSGDWKKAYAADLGARALLMNVGPGALVEDMRSTFEETRARLRDELRNERAAAGEGAAYTPFIEPTYTTYIPIVINATGDPAATAAAAQAGVAQALRQAGIQ